ncbi:8809_t:CDS:1, partial [Diversispora eburnea]
DALTLWIEDVIQVNINITNDILFTKVLEFTFLCKEDKFKNKQID